MTKHKIPHPCSRAEDCARSLTGVRDDVSNFCIDLWRVSLTGIRDDVLFLIRDDVCLYILIVVCAVTVTMNIPSDLYHCLASVRKSASYC